MLDLCATCLCRNRRLIPLLSLKAILSSLSWLDLDFNIDTDMVCWECHAVFLRIHRFREQVVNAQNALQIHINRDQPLKNVIHFSCLSMYYKNSYDEILLYGDTLKEEPASQLSCQEPVSQLSCQDPVSELSCQDPVSQLSCQERVSHDADSTEMNLAVNFEDDTAKSETIADDDDNVLNNDEYTVDVDDKSDTLEIKPLEVNNTNKFFLQSEPTKEAEKSIKKTTVIRKSRKKLDKMKLSKDEKKFKVKRISFQDMYKCRDLDRSLNRYKKSPYKCVNCITGYFNEDKYNNHLKEKHSKDIGRYKCTICDVRFKRPASLQYHHECHFRSYQCRECQHSHHRLATMLIHMKTEHAKQNYECKVCKQGFAKPHELRYHYDKCHKGHPSCNICGKTYATAHGLKMHMLLHTGGIELKECPHCGGKYRRLQAHLRTHDASLASESAFCAECGRQFKSVYIYRRHLVIHTRHRQADVLKFACTHCEARFVCKSNLSRHVASKHTKEYPFSCEHCGKGFLRKDRVELHILEKHEGIPRSKDKICSYCGRGFKDKQVLINHIRTHTGEKPYQCEYCPWRFTQRTALTTHVRALHLKLKGKPTRDDI